VPLRPAFYIGRKPPVLKAFSKSDGEFWAASSAASWMAWGVADGFGARAVGRLLGSLVAEGGHRLGLLSGPYQDLTDEGLRRLNDERRND
jgi:hypothetical protein